MQTNNKSIRSLSKINAHDTSSKQIKTFNFKGFDKDTRNKAKKYKPLQTGLSNYFDKAYNYQTKFYEVSKQKMILTGDSLNNEPSSRAYLEDYCKYNNLELYPFDSAQSEVLISKCNETISSFSKNKFLEAIKKGIYIKYLNYTDTSFASLDTKNKNKRIIAIFKNTQYPISYDYVVNQLDLKTEILPLFKYDFINIAYEWKKICELVPKQFKDYSKNNIFRDLHSSLDTLSHNSLKELILTREQVLKQYEQLSEDKKKNLNFLDYFVNNMYLTYNSKINEKVIDQFPVANKYINAFLQDIPNFIIEIKSKDETKIIQDDKIIKGITNHYAFKIKNHINYAKDDASQEVVKFLIQSINQIELIEESDSDKSQTWYSNPYLNLPKESPSYPATKKLLTWDKDYSVSRYLDDYNLNFKSLYMNLTKRLMFLYPRTEYVKYSNYYLNYLQKEPLSINNYLLDQEPITISVDEFKKLAQADHKDKEPKGLKITKSNTNPNIQILNQYDNNGKKYLDPITLNKCDTHEQKTEAINKFLKSKFNSITSLNSEFYLFSKIKDHLNIELIKNLIEKGIYNYSFEVNTIESINIIIKQLLLQIENHLNININQDSLIIKDKLSLKRYIDLQNIIMPSLEKCTEEVMAIAKAKLRNISYQTPRKLALKTSRMTNRTIGNSTILQTLEINGDEVKVKDEFYALLYPIKINDAKNVLIKDDLKKCLDYIKKHPDYELKCGFLNGDGDVKVDKKIHKFTNIKGEEKQYTTYENWTLINNNSNISIKDINRGNTETVGVSTPAGYPKLFFFLTPKDINECSSLIAPIAIDKRYLSKFTPYMYINEYLSLMKSNKAKEILELRCLMRNYYSLSSFEICLTEELKIINNRITPNIKLEGHFQTGIPVKEIRDTENPTVLKNKMEKEEVKNQFSSILSVDLGEKIIACFTLRKINWKNNSVDNINYLSSFLPIKNFVEDNTTKNYTTFQDLLNYNFENKFEVLSSQNSFDSHYKNITRSYKKIQTSNGVISKKLQNKKKGILDFTKQQVANQIVKLAQKHNALIVFENLKTGLSSRKTEVSLATDIVRLTYLKLNKTGIALGDGTSDNVEYMGKYANLGIARVNPFLTSQTCSNCGFRPLKYSKDREDELNINTYKYDDSKWLIDGKLIILFNQEALFEINHRDNELNIFLVPEKSNVNDKLKKIKRYTKLKDTDNYNETNAFEELKSSLITEKTKSRRKLSVAINQEIKKQLLNGRTKQDEFNCPKCSHKENADYNASKVIGNVFIEKFE
jgi:hypothetical protein